MKTHVYKLAICAAVLVFGPARGLQAQSLSIDWFKVAGGGGPSAAGQYSVAGTVGQADASTALTGGGFSVVGGYWSIIAAVESPGAPRLSIFSTVTNTVVVAWPAPSTGFVLQQTPVLVGPTWQDVSIMPVVVGGQKQVIISPPVGNWFFRLKK
jgi:hypothetical protein